MALLKKQPFLTILSILTLLTLFFSRPDGVQAQSGTPAEVLAEINGYRAANGLSPLAENQYLNIAAQNHVNWMVNNATFGHTGEGGSTATDRALAVGYGEGAAVTVTENWARGYNLTASGVVYNSWATSSIHNSQMLTTAYYEFGAGVALDGSGMTVYVVKFGRVTGGTAPQPNQPINTPGGPTTTPVPMIMPVSTAQPAPDGSVIHVVQPGQTLWAIAEAYDIPIVDLLAQNGLLEDTPIFPDDTLIIVPANQKTAEETTPTSETQATPTPTPSLTPTRPPKPTQTRVSPTPSATPNPRGNFVKNIFSGDTLWIGIGLVAVSIFGIALLLFTSSRLQ